MRILYLDNPMLIPAFKKLGHEVVSAGYSELCDIQIHHPRDIRQIRSGLSEAGFSPDLVFWCDSGNLPYFLGIEGLGCLTAFYSIDTYCNLWHIPFSAAFDLVFVAQREHLPLFAEHGPRVYWMPLCAANEDDPKKSAPTPGTFAGQAKEWADNRDIPISFVGTVGARNNPDRGPFLSAFRKRQPLVQRHGVYSDIFLRSRIAINQTACSEMNLRCFEAMACGAALLTEHSLHGLEELFTPGENILEPYARGDHAQAASIAGRALARPEELARIALNGRRLVATRHLAIHRAEYIARKAEELILGQASFDRLADLARRKLLLSSAYGMIGGELSGTGMSAYADFYLGMFEYGVAEKAG